MDERIIAAVQRLLDAQPERAPFTSAAIAVRVHDKTDALVCARAGRRPRFKADDRFLLYSFTKTIVAATLLKFVAAGRLSLGDTLDRWWPELRVASRLTLRHVLAHAAGLPDYGALAEYHRAVRAAEPPWSEQDFLARTHAETLLFEPGGGWAYSNIGYMLLRRVLAEVGAGDMQTVLAREIFDPLGIGTTSVPITRDDLASFAFGPTAELAQDGHPGSVHDRYHPGWIATGVVGATVADAARMLEGILRSLLPPSSVAEMTRPVVHFSEPMPGRPWKHAAYGLGLMIEADDVSGRILGHTGGGPGCSPAVYHSQAGDLPLTVAVVTDGEGPALAEAIAITVIREAGRQS